MARPTCRSFASRVAGLLLPVVSFGSAQDPPEEPIAPEDQAVLDEFAAALERFQGMTVDEFLADRASGKAYLPENEGTFLRADVNRDGALGIGDPICTLNVLFHGSASCGDVACSDAFDANDSGAIDLSDAVFTLAYLFLGGPEPPGPFPDLGNDPTPDRLECFQGTALGYDPLAAEHFPLITGRYPLSDAQRDAYVRNGFVIRSDTEPASFFAAFNEIYASHLPVYVSVDALLDALHLSFDRILMTLEEEILIARIDAMLAKMESGIGGLESHAGGADIGTELDDVAAWVCTARSLLAGSKVPCSRGVDTIVDGYLALVQEGNQAPMAVFGQGRLEDFSQFKPRGHYTRSEMLERYFRAMMWIQRVRMDFTLFRREAAVAYLITMSLIDTGAMADWTAVNGAIEALVGASDSLNPPGMNTLSTAAGIDSAGALRGDGFERLAAEARRTGAGRQLILSQILLSGPTSREGFTPIPPTFHTMGQRFVVDGFVFTNVVHDRVPGRFLPSPLDAWFVLGNRATTPLLEAEIVRSGHQANLAALEWLISRYPDDFWTGNLYNLWLSALRALDADTTAESFPPVLRTREWDRRMLHAQLASWAHLRHDTILYAKGSVTPGVCDYPEGWVDPYPDFYRKLASYAIEAERKLGDSGSLAFRRGLRIRAYFQALGAHASTLESIARAELAGESLTEAQTTFLKNILRTSHNCTGEILFDGWYPELIYDIGPNNAETFEPTIADVHTGSDETGREPRVLHVGVGHPSMMLISILNECGLKAYVGPVLSYHEVITGGDRLTDEEWKASLEAGSGGARPAWTSSFVRE